jgi:cytoskeleton protein RodZ
MPPIGETLREARMRQRLDIVDVEERTKIRAKYLRALENEEWGVLPGPTFIKTFLRTYAEVVGVDPHLLVEEYRTRVDPSAEAELQPLASTPVGREPRRRTRVPGPPGRGALAAFLALALVGFLLVLGLLSGGSDEEPANTESARTVEPARTTPRPARPRRAPRPRGAVLRVAPSAPTYVCVDTGQGTDVVFEGTLERARTFRHSRELRLNLGRRSVDVRANGRRVRIAESAEPYGLRVTRRGASEIAEGTRPCA